MITAIRKKSMFLYHATRKPFLALIFAGANLFAVPSYAETDAELMASGQWRDPATGLIWMRCSIGQKWTGSTCAGKPLELNWQDANDYFKLFNQDGFAGKKNWRLPQTHELVTIRRCSNGWRQKIESQLTLEGRRDVAVGPVYIKLNGQEVPIVCASDSSRPTLDLTIFPNTPQLLYWSESSNVHGVKYKHSVDFFEGIIRDETGETTKYYGDGDYRSEVSQYHVRAVRAGR